MKKIFFIVAVLGVVLTSVNYASATTLSFLPTKLTVVEGQKIELIVVAIPENNERNYTASIELKYPSDIFEVKSVTYWKGWVPVVRPDYDVDDSEKGLLIKTAGYPEGFTEQKVFAVVTFNAKKSGSGSITFGSNSFVLDANNWDTLSGIKLPSQSFVQTLGSEDGKVYALANILLIGERGNGFAWILVFALFLILYVIYAFLKKKEGPKRVNIKA